MEKIIVIEDKEIRLKANVKSALIYRNEFKEDILTSQGQFVNAAMTKNGTFDFTKIEVISIYKLLWTFAKTNDSKTLPFSNWLDTFENIPIVDILGDIAELVMSNMTSNSPIKNVTGEK